MDRLVVVTPKEVRFQFEVGQSSHALIRVQSLMHTIPVAYKVFTTSPHRYKVQSQPVILPPLGEHLLEISMAAQSSFSDSLPYTQDKIYVKSLMVPTGEASHAELEKWFSTRKKHVFLDATLRVIFTGKYILWRLATNGSIEAVKEVLKDTHPNAKDPQERTALFIAAEHGNAAVIKALLASKCDVNDKDADAHTPLFVAVLGGHYETVKMLLDAGADTEHQNACGWTCLHVAATQNRCDIVKVLLDSGANMDAHDEKGKTPLHISASEGHIKVLHTLVQYGANIDRKCHNGCTPLHEAASGGVEEAVNVLIQEGAQVSVKNHARKTCRDVAHEIGQMKVFDAMHVQQMLEKAVRTNNLKMVKECLQDGAYANVCDQYGWTALHRAAFKGHVEIVRLLLKRKFDMNMKDEEGYTPLQFAREAGHDEVVETLLRHGATDIKCSRTSLTLKFPMLHSNKRDMTQGQAYYS
ncbi:hypothetical protein L7F22_029302 [Adiantum nelumboides]|nr:hypothetical protein [Adiantum nelumboides]